MANDVALYIATHNQTGLKYFGKSSKYLTQEDLQKNYHGSGKYWLSHLNIHGDNVTMELIGTFSLDPNSSNFVKNIAIEFSRKNNIVESSGWANLIEENGLDGGIGPSPGYCLSEETKNNMSLAQSNKSADHIKKLSLSRIGKNHSDKTKQKISESCKGKKKSEEHKKKMSESAKNRPKISEETRQKLSAATKKRWHASKL